jgi:DNA-binding transcriptional LysR family regulator
MANWNDIRYFLAIEREGSLSGAARLLGVNQTTVSRRLAAMQDVIRIRLFDRVDGRLVPTAAAELLLKHARRVEEEALAFEHSLGDHDAALSGTVRLTAVESLIAAYLVPRLSVFRSAYPNIVLELVGDSGNLSLTRREADIAIRLARPTSGRAVTRKLADIGFSVYGRADVFALGPAADLGRYPWILYDDALAHLPEAQWVTRHVRDVRPVLRCNSVQSLRAAVVAGHGITVLPCHIGDGEGTLFRLSGPKPVVVREAWVITPGELRGAANVGALFDWLVDRFSADRSTLLGEV